MPLESKFKDKIAEYRLFHHGIETMTGCTHFAHLIAPSKCIYTYKRDEMIRHIEQHDFLEICKPTGCFKAVPIPCFAYKMTIDSDILADSPAPRIDTDGSWAARVFLDVVFRHKYQLNVWLAGNYDDKVSQYTKGDVYLLIGEYGRDRQANVELKTDAPAAKTGNLCVPIYEARRDVDILNQPYERR